MDHFIKTLPAILQAAGQSPEVIEASAIAAWNHVAGEQLKKHAVAISLSGKTLVIAVADSIWQKQLEEIKAQLLFRLKAALGQSHVTRLEFRIDAKSVPSAPVAKERRPREASQTDVSLEVWTAASSIQDKQLRRKLLAAAASNLRNQESS